MSLLWLSLGFLSFQAMTTSEIVCLLHNRKYSSNIQQVLNFLRVKKVGGIKCDLNLIGKRSLCICKPHLMQITDEQQLEFETKKKAYENLHDYQWFEELDRIVQMKIILICDSQIALCKFYQLICDIVSGENLAQTTQTQQKSKQGKQMELIHHTIELTLPVNQLAHLLGRDGHLHKQIMEDTNTRIHFNNAPYSIKSKTNHCQEFDLDLFQSVDTLRATITGRTLKAIENAVTALEQLDRETKANLQSKEI